MRFDTKPPRQWCMGRKHCTDFPCLQMQSELERLRVHTHAQREVSAVLDFFSTDIYFFPKYLLAL